VRMPQPRAQIKSSKALPNTKAVGQLTANKREGRESEGEEKKMSETQERGSWSLLPGKGAGPARLERARKKRTKGKVRQRGGRPVRGRYGKKGQSRGEGRRGQIFFTHLCGPLGPNATIVTAYVATCREKRETGVVRPRR